MPKHDGRGTAIRAGLGTVTLLSAALLPARVMAADAALPFALTIPRILTLVIVAGVVGFAIVSAIALTRARNRVEAENDVLRAKVASLKAAAERSLALLEDD